MSSTLHDRSSAPEIALSTRRPSRITSGPVPSPPRVTSLYAMVSVYTPLPPTGAHQRAFYGAQAHPSGARLGLYMTEACAAPRDAVVVVDLAGLVADRGATAAARRATRARGAASARSAEARRPGGQASAARAGAARGRWRRADAAVRS